MCTVRCLESRSYAEICREQSTPRAAVWSFTHISDLSHHMCDPRACSCCCWFDGLNDLSRSPTKFVDSMQVIALDNAHSRRGSWYAPEFSVFLIFKLIAPERKRVKCIRVSKRCNQIRRMIDGWGRCPTSCRWERLNIVLLCISLNPHFNISHPYKCVRSVNILSKSTWYLTSGKCFLCGRWLGNLRKCCVR